MLWWEILILALVVAFAGTLHSATGFGFNLLSMPFMLIFFEPKAAIGINLLLAIVLNIVLFLQIWRHLHLPLALPLVVASALGVTAGSRVLLVMPDNWLKLSIAVMLILFAAAELRGQLQPVNGGRLLAWAVGVLSGALTVSTGVGGPPVVLFLVNQNTEVHRQRATLVALFLLTNLIALAFLRPFLVGEVNVIAVTAGLIPALLIGALIGLIGQRIIPEQRIVEVSLWIVILVSLFSATQSLTV